jgi:hypothetical protein
LQLISATIMGCNHLQRHSILRKVKLASYI